MSYFIKYNDTFYYLDSTASVSYNLPAKLSKNPIFSGNTVSDNYIVETETVSISGIISDIKGYGALSDVSSTEYLNSLKNAINSKSPVSLKYRLDQTEEAGWFITSFNPTQNTNNGFSGVRADGSIVQSFSVNITLEKPITTRSLTVVVNPKLTFKKAVTEKKESSLSTEEEPEKETYREQADKFKKLFFENAEDIKQEVN